MWGYHIFKVKNDHRSKFSDLSNWKEEAWKNQGFNRIRTCDLRDTGARLYQLSYEATHWERGQFIEFISPVRSEMMWSIYEIIHIFELRLYVKVKNDHRSKFSNLSNWKEEAWKNQFKYMNYFIYTSHHFTPHGRYELNKLTLLPMCGFIAQLIERLHLSLLGKELTPAKSAKDLGVILDSNLTYDDHVTKTVSTCMSRLGQINRVKHVLDKDTLTIVVNCLVFSKLFYCSNVWSNTTESNLDKVQKVQNFACRIVSGVKKFDHITPVLRAVQWLPIRQLLYYRNAVMAFNCVTGCAPDSLTDQFIKRSDVSTRTTRNSQKLQIPLLKSATGQRSFYYRTVKIWNTLDPSLKLSKTLQEFKRKLKIFLLKDFMDRTT